MLRIIENQVQTFSVVHRTRGVAKSSVYYGETSDQIWDCSKVCVCQYSHDHAEKLLKFKILQFFYRKELQNSSHYFNFEIVNYHASYL